MTQDLNDERKPIHPGLEAECSSRRKSRYKVPKSCLEDYKKASVRYLTQINI